ncbi:helix-turn-helix domain-containing protein [uncultured Erythrobacter sp.]|uniref:MarR family winged helix-turn-helix transcriptional regulator n=1 Tax=uncultured Erythrobacter sp. TaxID=263913 RepID=UPI0026216D62|nr:helix-turn-helix domain-containing protein [uncultured Erythrobacter sp.]
MTIRNPKGEALTALILETFRINGELLSAGNRLTKPFGLTSARWQVIGAIDEAGQPLTVSQIARRMGLARQGVQRIVNDLKKADLLKAEPNIDHKRAPLFSISAHGEAVMSQVNTAQAEWVNSLAENHDPEQIAQALELLQSLRNTLEKQD